jgi:hypothetical protein
MANAGSHVPPSSYHSIATAIKWIKFGSLFTYRKRQPTNESNNQPGTAVELDEARRDETRRRTHCTCTTDTPNSNCLVMVLDSEVVWLQAAGISGNEALLQPLIAATRSAVIWLYKAPTVHSHSHSHSHSHLFIHRGNHKWSGGTSSIVFQDERCLCQCLLSPFERQPNHMHVDQTAQLDLIWFDTLFWQWQRGWLCFDAYFTSDGHVGVCRSFQHTNEWRRDNDNKAIIIPIVLVLLVIGCTFRNLGLNT